MHHPSARTLSEFVAGTLQGPRKEQLEEHLAGCDNCALIVHRLAVLHSGEMDVEMSRKELDRGWEELQRRRGLKPDGSPL